MNTQPKILVVEDDESARTFFKRMLSVHGYDVTTAGNGREAKGELQKGSFDVVLSDITMPEMSGVELLEGIRQFDLDVPVILVTGNPNVSTAAKAVQFGAFRYFTKPVDTTQLQESVAYAASVAKVARAKRDVLEKHGLSRPADQAGLHVSFARAVPKIWMAFQPIVSRETNNVYAYEALLRSDDKDLPHAGALLDAAERLAKLPEIGRTVRRLVAERIAKAETEALFFINLHPLDLLDDELYDPKGPLVPHAKRIVLEITERAELDSTKLDEQLAKLRAFGFRIALDDLGAGYAGLTSFVRLKPDIVKLDMGLVQGITGDETRTQLVRSVVELGKALRVGVVAEGIEEKTDMRTLMNLGVDLMQGYAFAKPTRELVALQPRTIMSAA